MRLKRLPGRTSNIVLAKLEGNNPAGSVKDRPALSMIVHAEARGEIKPGDTLIEPTSGNTGIALAMVAAMRGYRMVLVMPEHLSAERRITMAAFGAQIVLTPKDGGMEMARDVAQQMEARGEGRILDQFANPDNPRAHYEGTGPEIWRDTQGRLTHFVSSMGTTGTIMGCSRFFKEKNPAVQIVGCQPTPGSQIPGIRKWPEEYLPKIYQPERVDRIIEVSQGRRGGQHAASGAGGGRVRRRLVRRGSVGCARAFQGSRERDHCRDRLRPWRSLFVDWRLRLALPVQSGTVQRSGERHTLASSSSRLRTNSFGQLVVELHEQLLVLEQLADPRVALHRHQIPVACLSHGVQARPLQVLSARHPAQHAFHGAGAPFAAFDDPFQDAHVLAVARPEEGAVRAFAEPVDAERCAEGLASLRPSSNQ